MQMIILLFKQHIYQCKHNNCAYQINPMRYDRIRTQVHKAKRNHQLQQRIETRNLNVTYLQLISWYTCLRCASPRFSCNRIRCTIVSSHPHHIREGRSGRLHLQLRVQDYQSETEVYMQSRLNPHHQQSILPFPFGEN